MLLTRSSPWLRYSATAILILIQAWPDPATAQPSIELQQVATGLSSPVGLVNAGDGSGRLFVVEQSGTIRILNGTQVLPTPFLDISSKVLFGGERGLLGLAFDPSYTSNGHFYVYYTSPPAGAVTIARYNVTAAANIADPNSELVLKTQDHAQFGNHNGGSLVFGPDGCLYAGIGDGGAGGDPNNNGQNLGTLLAKIIRISPSDGSPCATAPGNPFVSTPGARGEIWALGVRNPWRITFDRQTGDLLIADVGQGSREEVDFQPKGTAGRNYCWRHKEGTAIFDASVPCTAGTPTDPVLEYLHVDGNCSITGGYRYRGTGPLVGTYFYGDYCSGRIWGATEIGGSWTTTELLDTTLNISSFGEDEAGELYVVNLGGEIYRLITHDTRCTVTFTPTDTPFGQPPRNLALSTTICQTNPSTGACINPTTPGPAATVTVAQNETVTISTFVQGQGTVVPYDPANNRIFVIASQGGTPVGAASAAVEMVLQGATMQPAVAGPQSSIFSAVAPNARTTTPNTAVTAFATIVNAGSVTMQACLLALPAGVSAGFLYQTTNPQDNTPVGSPNTPVDIGPGAAQTFYFAVTPTATFAQDIPIVFRCSNSVAAPVFPGVNTFMLTSSAAQLADMLSIAETPSHDGNVVINGTAGIGVIGSAAINLRACVQ